MTHTIGDLAVLAGVVGFVVMGLSIVLMVVRSPKIDMAKMRDRRHRVERKRHRLDDRFDDRLDDRFEDGVDDRIGEPVA